MPTCQTCTEQRTTHNDEDAKDGDSNDDKIRYKASTGEQYKKLIERVIGFRDDTKDCNQRRACCDEKSADHGGWAEEISKEEPGEESIPEERDCSQRSQNDNGECAYLKDGAEEVGSAVRCA